MADYIKVTLKEFRDMREAIESKAVAAQNGDDSDHNEAEKAVKAARNIEQRNAISPPWTE